MASEKWAWFWIVSNWSDEDKDQSREYKVYWSVTPLHSLHLRLLLKPSVHRYTNRISMVSMASY